MRCYILRATTSGIRNLVNPVTIEFCGSKITYNIKLNGNNIRAIYGANGSGKSALILSFLFAKNLMHEPYYLKSKSQKHFDDLLNKKTNTFFFKCDFAVFDEKRNNKKIGVFSYLIEVKKVNGSYRITHERLAENKAISLNRETSLILESQDGKMICNPSINDLFLTEFQDKTKNLLSDTSFVSLLLSNVTDFLKDKKNKLSETMMKLVYADMFALALKIFVQNEDLHLSYFLSPKTLQEYQEMSPDNIKSLFISDYLTSSAPLTKVKKGEYERFVKYTERLSRFIKIFKASLQKIKIVKKEDENYYYCTNNLVYPDYEVSEEFESTGIKKLIALFPFLDGADKGDIVFIDELDANISGVYLEKLIEVISLYGKGQLIFTAHSVEPMHYLYKFSKSVYFLGEENLLVSWIKNANYRPYTLYQEGMIEGCPFNVEPFDFLSAFGEGK
ncbi:MAG: ATP-binding protein [Bacilli bacterium]|jgi:AAA15 family ATPase/GTPase|nr:ATP-binding protein [Bacilli bacterium]